MDDGLDFDEVIYQLDDFGLSDAVSCAIEYEYGYESLVNWSPAIPRSFRIVHVTWSTTGFLEGEGFARFMNLDCHHSAYAECFEVIGLPKIAAAIRASLDLVPGDCLGDTDKLASHFGSWENLERLMEPTQKILFAAHDQSISSVAKFIRCNKSDFAELLPTISWQHSYLSKFHPDVLKEYHRRFRQGMEETDGQ